MKNSQSTFLSLLFILLVFSTRSYLDFRSSESVIENAEYFSRFPILINNSGRFQRNMLAMVNGLRGYLLKGEKSFIEPYLAANPENEAMIAEFSSLMSDSTQSLLLKEIKN